MSIAAFFRIIICGIGILIVMGCGQKGWLHDRSKDYPEAKAYPMIEIPPGVQAESFSHDYQIPGDR